MPKNNIILSLLALLFSMQVGAVGLQDVQGKLYVPTSNRLKDLDLSTADANTLLSAVLSRAQYKKSSSELSLADCLSMSNGSLALACKLILLGNNLNAGRLDTYATALEALSEQERSQAQSFIARLDGDVARRIGNRQANNPKNLKIDLVAEAGDFLKDYAEPVVDVEINGNAAKAIFDTGASATIISESDAIRYGVEQIAEPAVVSSYYGSKQLKARYGVIRKLNISGAEFSNVLVVVGGKLNLLGLDLISSFDSVVIANEHIALNLPDSEIKALQAQCVAHVFLGSTYSRQTQFLYFLTQVDGRQTAASIDTGNFYYLSGGVNKPGPAELSQKNTIVTDVNGAKSQLTINTMARLQIGSESRNVTYTALAEQRYLTPHVLGWAAFQDHELIWNTHESKACIKDKRQTK